MAGARGRTGQGDRGLQLPVRCCNGAVAPTPRTSRSTFSTPWPTGRAWNTRSTSTRAACWSCCCPARWCWRSWRHSPKRSKTTGWRRPSPRGPPRAGRRGSSVRRSSRVGRRPQPRSRLDCALAHPLQQLARLPGIAEGVVPVHLPIPLQQRHVEAAFEHIVVLGGDGRLISPAARGCSSRTPPSWRTGRPGQGWSPETPASRRCSRRR